MRDANNHISRSTFHGSAWSINKEKRQDRIMPKIAVAYVDESGNFTDERDRYIVLAAIVTTVPRQLKKVVRKGARKLKRSKLKKRHGREIKWVNAPDGTRRRVLRALAQKQIDIFWVAIDKGGTKIADTPDNYSLAVVELIRECLPYYPQLKLVLDLHFNVVERRDRVDELLMKSLDLTTKPVHLDSQQDAVIQLADFVAGALLYRLRSKGDHADIIEDKIVVGKVVKWKQLLKKKESG